MGGARTDLSGLTATEVRALFIVAGPASAATPAVKAALRKLVQALPEPFRMQAEAAASSMAVDPHGLGVEPGRAPTTPVPRRAPGRGDPRRPGTARLRRPQGLRDRATVHPLGIVAKGPTWYLVADTDAGRRTFRVDRVSSVDPTDDPVHRPEGFDLAESWREIADEVDRKRTPLEIEALCAPDGIGLLRIGARVDGSRWAAPRPTAASRS